MFDGSTYQEQPSHPVQSEARLHPGQNGPEILRLAQYIEDSPLEFRMEASIAHPDCGTAGCVIGNAALMWDKRLPEGGYWVSLAEFRERLGLNEEQKQELCFDAGGLDYFQVTGTVAVRALRGLAYTGEVHYTLQPGDSP